MLWDAAQRRFLQAKLSSGIYNFIFRRDEENGQMRDALQCASCLSVFI